MEQPAEETMMSIVVRYFRDTSGTTAIEYALIAAGISVAIVVGYGALTAQVKSTYENVSTSMQRSGM